MYRTSMHMTQSGHRRGLSRCSFEPLRCPEVWGASMRRRELITLLSGAAVAWPLAVRAKRPDRIRRIGVLMGFAESDRAGQALVATCRERLQKLGWAKGRNIRIDYRWTSLDKELMQRFAKDLLALQPDL